MRNGSVCGGGATTAEGRASHHRAPLLCDPRRAVHAVPQPYAHRWSGRLRGDGVAAAAGASGGQKYTPRGIKLLQHQSYTHYYMGTTTGSGGVALRGADQTGHAVFLAINVHLRRLYIGLGVNHLRGPPRPSGASFSRATGGTQRHGTAIRPVFGALSIYLLSHRSFTREPVTCGNRATNSAVVIRGLCASHYNKVQKL